MPNGRLQRIDEDNELAYVVLRGRTFAADLSDVETKARVPNARVRFDLVRRKGSERAANVRLRTGTRTSRRQRRFGDLSGAKRPGAKTRTIASQAHGIDVATQPTRVAAAWLSAVADGDHDGATSLYLSGATLHTPAGTGNGRRHIRAELERLDLRGVDLDGAEISGQGEGVAVVFDDRTGRHTALLIADQGHIVEQWIDVEPSEPEAAATDGPPAIEFVLRGSVPPAAAAHAEERIEAFIERLDRPYRYARFKLTGAENPAVDRPAMAQATVELDRFLLRAHATAESFVEAIAEVIERLAAQLESHHDRERHKPVGQVARPGTWRHANLARPDQPYFDRPPEERELVQHKSFAADELTVDEAAWDMAMLDYDFFLFVEVGSGQDTLIERRGDGPVLVHLLDPDRAVVTGVDVDHELAPSSPPELVVSDAIELLNGTGAPLLFFRNSTSGRGNVIYRRYDGHYGLITPPTDDTDATP